VGTLDLLAPHGERDALLGATAEGRTRLAVALGTGDDDTPPFRLESSRERLVLHGQAEFVPDAGDADHLLLLATDPSGTPVVVCVAGGVDVQDQPVLDETRRFARVSADGLVVPAEAVWQFSGDPAGAARSLWLRGALAVACDSLGVSEAMLDATVEYAGVRQQFGRPIGSFQAVKHACADMLVSVTIGRELVDDAVRALVRAPLGPDTALAVSRAASAVPAAAVEISGKAMQLHGGMGYTWESGIHTYLKRATLSRSLFGSPTVHRRRLVARFG
jgi:alkylation response protein AidB-like acyl-CoA dehydrogenase